MVTSDRLSIRMQGELYRFSKIWLHILSPSPPCPHSPPLQSVALFWRTDITESVLDGSTGRIKPMKTPSSLPANCHIRQAKATDIWTIRWLVLGAKLDPTQLRWQQFWLVEHHKGQILACGQLRTFVDCQELGSLVVRSPQRRQGLGTALTRHLLQQATTPLYLECLGSQLAEFYQRLGFRPVVVEVLPSGLRRKFGFSSSVARLLRLPLYQMHWPQKQRNG